ERGEFRIVVPTSSLTLGARAIGYKRGQVRVTSDQSSVEIALERDILRLEAVLVTGEATGVESKNAAVAVRNLTAEQLSTVPAQSAEQALQGKVPGALINMNSGAPGGGGQIQIRGVTTILGNGQPLFVVDGVVISNDQIASGANTITNAAFSSTRANISSNQDNATNRLADLVMGDIESVQVLEGAAASASIYGSRATNGVVIIKTKRGRVGEAQFHVTQRLGTYDAIRLPCSPPFRSQADAYDAARANIGDTARAWSVLPTTVGSRTTTTRSRARSTPWRTRRRSSPWPSPTRKAITPRTHSRAAGARARRTPSRRWPTSRTERTSGARSARPTCDGTRSRRSNTAWSSASSA